MASTNTEERKTGVLIIHYLSETEKLPPELAAALIGRVADTDETVAQIASATLTKAAQSDTTLKRRLESLSKVSIDIMKKVAAQL